MSMGSLTPFSLTGPLPSGTVVLEASAGTGKTYAIAALAARFVAEGRVRLPELLLVTFSRAATAELRSRVRERLSASADALAAFAAGGANPDDEVDRLLCADGRTSAAERAERLAQALARFDQATIMTTHEFCHGMLRGLGVLAPQEPQSRLTEDLISVADEAASDVYLRRYAFDERTPPFPFASGRNDEPGARSIARDAVTMPSELGPQGAPGAVGERVAYAAEVRGQAAERMRRRRLFSFDDQLTRLAEALDDPQTGPLARTRLSGRFPVVLVDEFQDTDPIQWRILRSAFGHDSATSLVLIGDPKQAIYAFRGADVHTYTMAAAAADAGTTLTRNFRADPHVVRATGGLFRGVALGEGIAVPPVDAARTSARLVATPGTPWAAGIQLRADTAEEPVSPWVAERRVTDDLVGVVGRLLTPDADLARPDGSPLRAYDMAVLVRSNYRGKALAEALSAAGIAATFSGTTSVFASEAATDWLTLLRALESPRRPFVQRAVLTGFMGGTLTDLATADDASRAQWWTWLHHWARALRSGGVPGLVAAIEGDTDMTARLLGTELGERAVTDHRHLAELLHHEASRSGASPRELADWLVGQAQAVGAASEQTRRLETDAAAVQIMTIHRAKGLQFPVVLLPEANRDFLDSRDTGQSVVTPLPDSRQLDVGGRLGPDRAQRWSLQALDDADESLRALYVAITRAQSHVVAWWTNHWDTAKAPLHRLLHANHDGAPRRPDLTYDTAAEPGGGSPLTLDWLAAAGIAATTMTPDPVLTPSPSAARPSLTIRAWERSVDQQWRRTSYSGLTAAAHEGPEMHRLLTDEPTEPVAVAADPQLATVSPMAELPGGAAFGSLVHSVLETLDPRGDNWTVDLRDHVEAALRRWPIEDVGADALTAGLAPALTTPLGPLAEGTTLRSFGLGNRLSELDFEFALGAPDATLADVAALLREHLPPGSDLADYPDRLTGPELTSQRLHGFLTGSIDAVFTLPSGAFLVADYKTNRLDAAGSAPSELTLGHYTQAAMAEAMMASHYPLQALLYSVALHRFLRQRLRGYQPERHLAGTTYLFVRGMAGPDTPVLDGHPTGVFSWRPGASLVAATSLLLAGGAR